MFGNFLGINPMGLSASLANYKKIILRKHKNFTTIIKIKHKNSRDRPNEHFFPLGPLFIDNNKNYQNIDNNTNMAFFLALDFSLNNCERLIQWGFVSLGPTLNYKTSYLINLRNFLENNQCID